MKEKIVALFVKYATEYPLATAGALVIVGFVVGALVA